MLSFFRLVHNKYKFSLFVYVSLCLLVGGAMLVMHRGFSDFKKLVLVKEPNGSNERESIGYQVVSKKISPQHHPKKTIHFNSTRLKTISCCAYNLLGSRIAFIIA